MTAPIDTKALRELEAKSTKGPWRWTAGDGDPQIEGNVEYPEASPVLVASGCRNEHRTSLGIQGCMPEKLNDQLRACPMHPHANDRELIVALRNAAPALLDEIESLREKVERYESAARNPGDGERHRGTSVAIQLVHAQMKREETEAERDALKAENENLRAANAALESRLTEAERELAESRRLHADMCEEVEARSSWAFERASVRAALGFKCRTVDEDMGCGCLMIPTVDRAREVVAERDALRAENERLREALRGVVAAIRVDPTMDSSIRPRGLNASAPDALRAAYAILSTIPEGSEVKP